MAADDAPHEQQVHDGSAAPSSSAHCTPLSSRPETAWDFYGDKNVLAPMVRVGHLPTRLLALQYGADIVYGPETIDKRLMSCSRQSDAVTGTTVFVDHDNKALFTTCALEREKVVMQIGTNNAVNALKAAEVVAKDVAAIDVNMGCPKPFSTQGAMGSRLLSDVEKARDIMATLRRNLPSSVHVTCKIRLLDDVDSTVAFARAMEACGISALGVHARYIPQRPRDAAHWKLVKPVVDALACPVILSGDVFTFADFQRARDELGVAAAMTARGAQWNASIFRADGFHSNNEVREAFLQKCCWMSKYPYQLAKFQLQEMMLAPSWFHRAPGDVMTLKTDLGRAIQSAKSLRGLCEALDPSMARYHDACVEWRAKRGSEAKEAFDDNGDEHPFNLMHRHASSTCM